MYKKHSTARVFTLFRIIDACGSDYELKILRESYGRVLSTQLNEGYELKSLEFGTMLDLKEEIFRDFVSIIHTVCVQDPIMVVVCSVLERDGCFSIPVAVDNQA